MRPVRADRTAEKQAFSLIELLFAMTLVSLIAACLLAVLNATSQIWHENEQRVGSYREARSALNFMARELSTAYAGVFQNLETFLLNPDEMDLEQSSVATNPEWGGRLFFLTSVRGDGQIPGTNRSDLCAVGYFLAYTSDQNALSPETTSSNTGSYKLYRFFRSGDSTFQILTQNDEITPLFEADPFVEAEIMAMNVTRFTVKAYTHEPVGVIEWSREPGKSRPEILELSLTTIGDSAAKQLRSKADWENHASTFHKKHARTFTTRVRLPAPSQPTSLP